LHARWKIALRALDLHLNFAHLLLLRYLAHDTATTSGTRLPTASRAIALAVVTFFTSSRHVLSAFSSRILAAKWLQTR
jgi:hypothetical protein